MRNNDHRLRRGLALAIAVSALAAPTASAVTAEQFLPSTSGGQSQAKGDLAGTVELPAPAPASSPVSDDGFDWGDAGLGATAMLALAAIAAGAAVAVGHRPRRGHTVA